MLRNHVLQSHVDCISPRTVLATKVDHEGPLGSRWEVGIELNSVPIHWRRIACVVVRNGHHRIRLRVFQSVLLA